MKPLALLAGLLALGLSAPVVAQAPVALTRPDAVVPEAFSSIRGVRELSSGRLLVADWIEERVALVDPDAGTVADRVVAGPGPAEVRLPSALVAMAADSTLLVDLGNTRLSVLDPGGRVARSLWAQRPGMVGTGGVDGDGGLYFAIPGWAAGREALPDDSVRLVRMDPVTGATRPVAVLQGSRSRSDAGAPSRTPRIPVVGYASRDGWTLTREGEVVVVRGGDYHVEFIDRFGARRGGPSYAGAARPVTDADRLRFVERFLASSPMSGRGPDGGMGHAPLPEEREVQRMVRGTQFAETHPHFVGEPLAAPGGGVWVARSVEHGSAAVYDVFDRDGVRVAVVELPAGRTAVAVGTRGVYAVVEGELGLQSLERYRVP